MMQKNKILVVDDEPEIVKSLCLRLRASGYDVVSASDGFSATQVAVREMPDLVLLDIGMPAGDGHVVANRLRENARTAHIPIIFLTARTAIEDVQQAKKEGVDKYVTKPFQPEALLRAIRDLLDGVPA